MFDTELKYFIDNQAQLVAKHRGKVLILRGAKVEGVFDHTLGAYLAAKEKFEPGTYMIQSCEPGVDAYSFSLSPTVAS